MLAYAENGVRELLHPYLRLNSALITVGQKGGEMILSNRTHRTK